VRWRSRNVGKRVLNCLWMVLLVVALLVPARTAGGPVHRLVVVLCSPAPAWCDAIKEEFPKVKGIALEYVRLSSGEALARLRAERRNPTFDVWFGGTGDPHMVAFEEGLTEFYRPRSWNDLRPELREAVAERYIPLYTGVLGWALNERLLREKGAPVPRTWRDLADPRYRRLIAYPNPNTSGTGYTMLATLVQLYGEQEAFALLRRIHPNVAEYTRSGGAPSLLVARGEVGVGITFLNDAVDKVLKGFPISYGAPRDGTGYEIGGLSLVKGAPHRVEAIAFIEWALTPEAQRLGSERGESYDIPSNIKTPVPSVVPRFEAFRVIKYDFLKYGSSTLRERLLKRWTEEVYSLPR
jgi:iron(III) transport system substrate-binding protein